MNKNTAIALVVIVVLGGFFYWLSTGNTKLANNTNINPITDNSGNPVTPVNTVTAGAPVVTTNSNAIPSISTVVVTGQVTPNGAQTMYWYDFGLTSDLGSKTAIQNIGSGWSPIYAPTYITGLKANTTYYFRLRASNRFAGVTGDTYSFTTNNTPAPTANIPLSKTGSATNVSRTTATVGGQVTPRGSLTSYWFEYGTDTDLGNATGLTETGNGTDAVNVSTGLSNLLPATKYYFRVDSQNQYGTAIGATSNFTTQGPSNASTPVVNTNPATNITSSSVALNGTINPNGSGTTYWFEYGTDSLLGNLLGTVTVSQTLNGTAPVAVKSILTKISGNTSYYYRLVARNQFGSVNGTIVLFKTDIR
jgi:hypothetical protein